MIAACRSLGLAARYVSGYLLTPPPGQPRLIGADASHAWVELWCPNKAGSPSTPPTPSPPAPTTSPSPGAANYADVAPLRGVIRGGGKAQPRVAVTVEPLGVGA